MGNKRMAAIADFAAQAGGFRSGLGSVELIALVNKGLLNTVKAPEEIQMPPGTAELTVSYSLEADFFLLCYELDDFSVFNFFQLGGGNFTVFIF
ncbi:hypothetical protein D3C76_1428800 [compost metagenome]